MGSEKEKIPLWLKLRAAGELHGNLMVNVESRGSCGEVVDGLHVYWDNDQRAPEYMRGTPRTAGFVISFEDLERVYLAAKDARRE